MKSIISWLQNFRPIRIFMVFVAGIFLLLVQACDRGIAALPPQPIEQPPNAQRYDPTKDYPISPFQGGMNNFSDVDPRAKAVERTARERADALVRNAERNITEKGVTSPEELIRNYQEGAPFQERTRKLGENVGRSTEEVQEGVTEGTKRGTENLQENIGNAAQDFTKSLQRGAEDTGKNVQHTAEDAAAAVNRTLREAD
jgi:flagellar biosynthesis/type III secretory pathway protein FliH